MTQLTQHKQQMYYTSMIKYIRQIIASLGYSPTVREIGEYMGWSSSGTTAMHLQRMRELGLIDWKPRAIRTIRTTEAATKYLARHDS